jgi:hypothetical protein
VNGDDYLDPTKQGPRVAIGGKFIVDGITLRWEHVQQSLFERVFDA